MNKLPVVVLGGILMFLFVGGDLNAETLIAEDPPSLEKKLEGSPLQIREGSLAFTEGFHPELVRPVENHYQSRFSNGLTAFYTVEPFLQEKMKKYFKDRRVPYGVFVAIDPYSGRVLAMVEHSSYHPKVKGWAVKASYPSASVFKLVTAAAAIEEKKASPDTMISFQGGLYHLRRNNWEVHPERDFRKISLTDALAKSANVPFAKAATLWLDNATLLNYANAFGFNQAIPFEIPLQISHASIAEDPKEVAYTAAGFGDTEMSPIHGALIASAIGNGGDLIVPHLIDKIIDQEGNEIYSPKREVIGHVVSSNTTELLKEMMGQTIISGTSRRAFRRYHRSAALRDITVGGKTGSLTGNDPPGKYSWFVGMAPLEKPEVAIAALVINNGHWRIKGSDVAKEGFTNFFKYRD
ncbi:MAG: penicillin-binding protein [Nitrospirae bacterium]|nr:penicillin-binding protein [Nitrospirota bacterium]